VRSKGTALKLTDLKTSEQVLAEELRDPTSSVNGTEPRSARGGRAEGGSAYRIEHSLSQRGLAKNSSGMTQPQLARLEAGEHNPTIDTLARLAQTLDTEFAIDVHPHQRPPKLLSARARGKNAIRLV